MTIKERILTKPGYRLLLVAALVVGTMSLDYKWQVEEHMAQTDCTDCHNKKAQFAEYFRRNGSKTPEQMADAVLATRSPRLMAAVAKVESNGNPDKRKTGYKKRHDGAFQVNPRHWGKVSHDPVEQALQAEAILTELTQTMPIKKALSVYGGDSTDRYSRKVLAELVEVPR